MAKGLHLQGLACQLAARVHIEQLVERRPAGRGKPAWILAVVVLDHQVGVWVGLGLAVHKKPEAVGIAIIADRRGLHLRRVPHAVAIGQGEGDRRQRGREGRQRGQAQQQGGDQRRQAADGRMDVIFLHKPGLLLWAWYSLQFYYKIFTLSIETLARRVFPGGGFPVPIITRAGAVFFQKLWQYVII